ncbi:MAG: HK97 gp10 family phage protein [Atopobiaceae bacterium]|jgi:hypothetical protein|nr:HK97 gp10 family phage protein [Atopobiaceae bacterium]
MSEMDRFKKVSSQALDKAANECADEAVKRLKESSPVGPSKKHYAKGWKKEVERESSEKISVTIWNAKKPGLAHLLEFGHAKRGGGRVGPSPEGGHIEPVDDWVQKEYESRVEELMG